MPTKLEIKTIKRYKQTACIQLGCSCADCRKRTCKNRLKIAQKAIEKNIPLNWLFGCDKFVSHA